MSGIRTLYETCARSKLCGVYGAYIYVSLDVQTNLLICVLKCVEIGYTYVYMCVHVFTNVNSNVFAGIFQ